MKHLGELEAFSVGVISFDTSVQTYYTSHSVLGVRSKALQGPNVKYN